MRLSRVDLNLFVVFDAIYTKRNLTRAAEVLFITQPAVSNALARMRNTFNDPLFVSTPKGMVPTPVAENIYSRVNEALNLLSSSVQESDLFVPQESTKTFKLSMNDLSESLLLPKLSEYQHRETPHISLESFYTPRPEMVNELTSGRIDLAVDAPIIEDSQLLHCPLAKVPLVCMIRNEHPWQGDKLSLDDYLKLSHIHVSSRRQGPGLIDMALSELGKKRKIHTRVQHYMVAPLIALRSNMALTAPYTLVSHYDARLLELPFEVSPMNLHMYWHRSSDQDRANRWLRDLITSLISDTIPKA